LEKGMLSQELFLTTILEQKKDFQLFLALPVYLNKIKQGKRETEDYR
jgi:hypothetical protein